MKKDTRIISNNYSAEGAEAFVKSKGLNLDYVKGIQLFLNPKYTVIDLMTEFAAQQQPTAEGANESIKFYYEGLMSDFNILLKDFYLWVDKNYALGMLTDKYDDVIKEYLEDKGKGKTLKSTHN